MAQRKNPFICLHRSRDLPLSSPSILSAHDLAKSYDGRLILDDVTVLASSGQRIGLVGENGAGKSTLLRLLAGLEEPDAGTLHRPKDCGYLHQQLPFALDTPMQGVIDAALADIRSAKAWLKNLAERMRDAPDDAAAIAEYGTLLEFAENCGLWDVDIRVNIILEGLGLGGISLSRPLTALSGGQRARLGLAALLVNQPRALLLDEPTNHLDDAAIRFLESQLKSLRGVVVVASHDRVFLDQVCTDIIDLDPSRGGVTRYGGAYTAYLDAKRQERLRWKQQFEAEQDQLRELRHAVDITARAISHGRAIKDNNKLAHNRAGARVQSQVARRVRNTQNRLDALSKAQIPKPPEPLIFKASLTGDPGADRVGISLRDVLLNDRLDIKRLDVSLSDRLMIVGPNGAGKSTLLHIMAGLLTPHAGDVRRATNIRVKLLRQDVAFRDDNLTPRQIYEETLGPDAAPLLSLGLVPPKAIDRPLGLLSLGQQKRVALALIVADPPEILLLDEPTNHFSLSLLEELESALHATPGGVVVASHDRWLRHNWMGTIIEMNDGKIVA